MSDLYLWVDNEDSTGAWDTAGSPPYLSSQDQPTNYIYDSGSGGRNSNSGVYSFQTTGETGTITAVTLYVYCIADSGTTFASILSSSDAGLTPGASWGYQTADVSSILTDWSAINSATIYFDRPNTTEYGAVDAVYIHVEYSGAASASDNQPAYTKGQANALDNQPAYTKGQDSALDNQPAYAVGGIETSDSKSAYTVGEVEASDNKSAYAVGSLDAKGNQSAYTVGGTSASTNKSAYAVGEAQASDNQPAYMVGSINVSDNQPAYMEGAAAGGIEYIDYVTVNDYAQSHSANLTIPTGATFALIGMQEWESGGNSITAISLDGQTAYEVDRTTYNSAEQTAYLYRVSGFETGSKNFSCSWNSAPDEGVTYMFLFFSGVDTSDPIHDYGQDHSTLINQTLTVSSLASSTSDYVAGIIGASGSVPDMDTNGQTEVDSGTCPYAGQYSYCYKAGSGSTDSIQALDCDHAALIACTLNPAAGGTETSDNQPAYTKGQDSADDNQPAYTKGQDSVSGNKSAYAVGSLQTSDSQPAYIAAGTPLVGKASIAGVGEQTTTGIDTTGADFLLVVISSYDAAVPGTFSDNKGNSWTWGTSYGDGENGYNVRIAYCIDPDTVGSGHTVTHDVDFQCLFFYAFSGMSGGSFDTENGAAQSSNTGSITPDETDELLVSAFCCNGIFPASPTVDGGFIIEDLIEYDNGVNPGGGVALDNVYESASSVSATWTNINDYNNAVTIVAFKLSGAATASDNQAAYTSGQDSSSDNQEAYTVGKDFALDNQAAYIVGQSSSSDNQPSYMVGQDSSSDNQPAYTVGQDSAQDNVPAYAVGSLETSDNNPAYLVGSAAAIDNVPAYLVGSSSAADNQPSYLVGQSSAAGNQPAYVVGSTTCPLVDIYDGEGRLITCGSAGSYARAIANATPTSDVEALLTFQFAETDAQAHFRVVIRGSGDWSDYRTPTQGYEFAVASDGGYVIYRIESGSRSQLDTGTWSASTNAYWVRFRAVSTDIKVRIWQDGSGEPGVWDKEIDDSGSGFTDAGVLQLNLSTTSGSVQHTVYVDDISYHAPAGVNQAYDNAPAYLKGQDTATDSQPAYIVGSLSTSDSQPAYMVGAASASDNQEAYLKGQDSAADNQPAYIVGKLSSVDNKAAYLVGSTGAQDSKSAYTKGSSEATDSQPAYVVGQDSATSSKSAYLYSGTAASDSKHAYINATGNLASDNKSAYLTGIDTAQSSKNAYLAGGYKVSSNKSAYLKGQDESSSGLPAYVVGQDHATGSKSAYLVGAAGAADSKSAYIVGQDSASDSKSAYLVGSADAQDNKHAYIPVSAGEADSRHAYLVGKSSAVSAKSAYLVGGIKVSSNKEAYLVAKDTAQDTKHAYVAGGLQTSDNKHAYLEGYRYYASDNKHAYMRAQPITERVTFDLYATVETEFDTKIYTDAEFVLYAMVQVDIELAAGTQQEFDLYANIEREEPYDD